MKINQNGRDYIFVKTVYKLKNGEPLEEFYINRDNDEGRIRAFIYFKGTNRDDNTGKEIDGITREHFRFPFLRFNHRLWRKKERTFRKGEKMKKEAERLTLQKDLNITA